MTTYGTVSPLSHAVPVLVGIDTHAEVDLVDIKLVQQLGLKPCRNKNLPILQAVNQQDVHTYGVYNIRLGLTDSYGTSRTTLRPYIAIDRSPGDSQILLGMTALNELKILLDCENYQWQYKLDKTSIRLDSYQRFCKRARNANVYALIEINHLISSETTALINQLPDSLKDYLDVFLATNAKKLAPHRDIDLAIDLQSLFAPKKDGGLRLCVDYRGLNAITVKNRYPLPLITEIMDRVTGANYFSKIDLKDAYYRLRIKEGDEWKTAFRTRYGHYEFLVVPMGLTNSPATFQAYINKALCGLVDDFCIVYLDDILVFSKTKEEHDIHLQRVCERLRGAELYAKPSKCQFYQTEIEFLGFIIRPDGIKMDPKRVQTIKEWENHPPRSYRDLQVLLGFCNFYRRFIQDYSAIARPLTSLFKGSQNGRKTGNFSKEWGSLQQQAFLELLGAFQKAPLLCHYNPELAIRLETDASDAALGGILSQLQKDTNKWHPIAFFSRQFKGAEVNYSTPDKELMAIVECFKHWRHYLEGSCHTIEVWSDHQNLQGFMKQPRINGRQARWLVYLTPYDFIIKHRPGLLNPADGPSRRPDYKAQQEPSLVQKDLLAKRLVESDPDLPEAARLDITQLGLCNIAKCQLCEAAKPGLHKVTRPEFEPELCDTARPELDIKVARPELRSNLPEAELCEAARATRRVNALSPLVDSKGQWALLENNKEAVGPWTPIATVQVLCATPRAEDSETGHLLELVRLQAVTRQDARKAVQGESPLVNKTAEGLLDQILTLQGSDPLCLRLKKELGTDSSREGYSLDQKGLLYYKGRVVVPLQKSLIQELLYLYHDDQFSGHWGIDKTKELLERKFYWPGLVKDVREYISTCQTCQNIAILRWQNSSQQQPTYQHQNSLLYSMRLLN